MPRPRTRKPGRPPNPIAREERHEAILDAAAQLFAERGYADANTQVLADTLGLGKGTIYRYFPSKQDLFLAAVDRVMRQMTATIDPAMEGVEEPMQRMLVGMRAYLAFFAEQPECVELIMQERAQFKDRQKPTYFVHRDANVGRWQTAFRALIDTRPRAQRAGRADHHRARRPALRDDVHELLHGPHAFARSPGARHIGHHVLRHPERSERASQPPPEERRSRRSTRKKGIG